MATTKKAQAVKVPAKKAAVKTVTPKAPKILAGGSEATIFDMKGAASGTLALPAEVFSVQWNADLVHQVVLGMEANARPTVANTKFRGEVAGGGKKPWKQKGTGRARHGSTRSPIWKGGGVTHGPRKERDYSVKINKKMRRAALVSLLSRKWKDGEIIFIDKLEFAKPSTSVAIAALAAVSKAAGAEGLTSKRQNAALIALSSKNTNAEKSIRNIGNVSFDEVRNLNVAELAKRKYLVIENPAASVALLAGKTTSSSLRTAQQAGK